MVPFDVAVPGEGRGGRRSTAVGRAAVTTAGRARLGTPTRALGILFPPLGAAGRSGRRRLEPPPAHSGRGHGGADPRGAHPRLCHDGGRLAKGGHCRRLYAPTGGGGRGRRPVGRQADAVHPAGGSGGDRRVGASGTVPGGSRLGHGGGGPCVCGGNGGGGGGGVRTVTRILHDRVCRRLACPHLRGAPVRCRGAAVLGKQVVGMNKVDSRPARVQRRFASLGTTVGGPRQR